MKYDLEKMAVYLIRGIQESSKSSDSILNIKYPFEVGYNEDAEIYKIIISPVNQIWEFVVMENDHYVTFFLKTEILNDQEIQEICHIRAFVLKFLEDKGK